MQSFEMKFSSGCFLKNWDNCKFTNVPLHKDLCCKMLTKHGVGIVHFNLVWAITNSSAIDNLDKEFIDVLHYYFWKLLPLQQYLKSYILTFVLYPKLKTWITIILEYQVIKSEDKIIPYSYNYDLQMRHKYNFGLPTCWVWCWLVICTWEIEEGGTPWIYS